jgi:hypothetical protein
MFIIVDGTGPLNQQDYDMAMARSFCWQLSTQLIRYPAEYISGPASAGLTTYDKAWDAYHKIKKYLYTFPTPRKIYLAGYSRGGACVIYLASLLKEDERHIEVEAMFLFDPVNFDANLPDPGITSNVKNAYIVFRDQTIEEVNTAWKPNYGYGVMYDKDIYARKWMGNSKCSPIEPSKTNVELKIIKNSSHGAVGGVPWVERSADKQGVDGAVNWMNPYLKKHKLPAVLKDMWFVNKKK